MAKETYIVTTTTADILANPEDTQTISKNDSQLLFGEEFEVTEERGHWLYGTSVVDGYEGHIHQSSLVKKIHGTTHFVDNTLTHIYPEPDFKTRPILDLSFLSRVVILDEEKNGFVETTNGWIFKDHLKPMTDMKNKDPLESARAFLGTPYIYGGRSSLGLDCAGLVQVCLFRNGAECPRDSNQQIEIGEPIDEADKQEGDLVFFPGHVVFLLENDKVLNATARTMDTRIENLSTVIDHYGPISAIKRVS